VSSDLYICLAHWSFRIQVSPLESGSRAR